MASSSTSQGNGSGRKKMNMALIEKKSNLQVTFSKRRTGLFKKASELCTLTGTEMAIVVFSPGKKVFSFGHPSVNNIMNKCFPEGGERNDDVLMRYGGRIVEAHRETNLEQLHEDVKTAELELEEERKRSAAIDERVKTELQWLKPTEKMTESELDEMNSCLRALEDAVTRMRVSMGGEPNLTRPSFVSDMDNRGFEPVNDPNVGNMVMNPVGLSDMNNMGNMVHVPNMEGVNPMYVPVMNQMGELLPVSNMDYSGAYQMPVPNMGYLGTNQMGELLPVPNIGYSDINQTGELLPVPNLGYTDMTYPLMNMENQSMNQMGRVEPIMDLANTGMNSDMENPYMNPFGVPVPMPDMGNPGMNPMDGQVQDMDDWDFNPMDRVDMGSNLFH